DLAVAEDIIRRNPVYLSSSMLLFVPRECTQPKRPKMNEKEVKQAIDVLDLRERLVVKLAVLAGMRVSEIFGLRRGRVKDGYVEIRERVCKRDVDVPKTAKAVRCAALPSGLQQDLKLWLSSSPDTGGEGWLFPSEKLTTPIGSENMLNRYIRPRLKTVGLEWIELRAMRGRCTPFLNKKGVNPNVTAVQKGLGAVLILKFVTLTLVENRCKIS